jgi:hypothetical protein
VKEKILCFRYFTRGHPKSKCKRREKCWKDGCKRDHRRLLHGVPCIYPAKTTTASVPIKILLAEEASDLKFTGTTRGEVNRKVTLLPIVQVVIRANGKRFETLALLDGASEVTMICEEVVKHLGLSGRQEIVRIGT